MFDNKKTGKQVHEAAEAKIMAALDRNPEFDEDASRVYESNKRLINDCRIKRLEELGEPIDSWLYHDGR